MLKKDVQVGPSTTFSMEVPKPPGGVQQAVIGHGDFECIVYVFQD